jgi:hypothetical protein
VQNFVFLVSGSHLYPAKRLFRRIRRVHDRIRSTILVEERPAISGNNAMRPPRAFTRSPPVPEFWKQPQTDINERIQNALAVARYHPPNRGRRGPTLPHLPWKPAGYTSYDHIRHFENRARKASQKLKSSLWVHRTELRRIIGRRHDNGRGNPECCRNMTGRRLQANVSRSRNMVGELVPPQSIAEIQNSLRRQRTGNPSGSLPFQRASVRDDDRKHLLQLTASSELLPV